MLPKRIEYLSSNDKLGRCSFLLYWVANYHPGHPDGEHGWRERGQCFYADPREYGHARRPEELRARRRKRK